MARAALITGAATRIGRAMAVRLAELGHDVAVHYGSRASDAEETADLIRSHGRRAVCLQADLLDYDQTDALVGRAAEALGQLHVLVNNASIFEHDTLETATLESWNRHLNSNLRAPFQLTQNFAAQAPPPHRCGNGEPVASACVVNMIDQRVRKLTPEFMTYTLAKSALWTFTQTAAQALAPRIRVNGIGPGPTLKGAGQSPEQFARQRKATVLQRGSDTDDLTNALGYVLSAKAVTGQLFCVDGGQHLGWQTPDVVGVE